MIGVLGGLVAACAFLFSSMAETVEGFLVIFGVVGGFGFGMIYVPSIVVVGFYFEKWRALATSIAVTGSAVGIICFPFLIEQLLEDLDWWTKFKVIAGGCLLTSFLALVYRPLKPVRVKNEDPRSIPYTDSIGSFHVDKKPGFFRKMINKFHNVKFPTAKELHCNSTVIISLQKSTTSSTSVFLSTVPGGSMTTIMKSVTSKVDNLSTVYEDEDSEEEMKKSRWKWCRYIFCSKCCKFHRERHYANRPMYRDDIFFSTSIYTIPNYSKSVLNSRVNSTAQVSMVMNISSLLRVINFNRYQVIWTITCQCLE